MRQSYLSLFSFLSLFLLPLFLSFTFLFSLPPPSNRLYLFTQVMNTQWMQPSLTTVWEIPSSSESETSCDIMHRPTLVLPDNEHDVIVTYRDIMVTSWWHHGDLMVTYVVTWWPHGDIVVTCGDLMVTSWWHHGDIVVTCGDIMMTLWWRGDLMVTSWWHHGDIMVTS